MEQNRSFAHRASCRAGRRWSPAIAIAWLLSIVFATGQSTTAATINVPGDYADIQSAINASQNGDLILIAAGTYAPTTTLNTMGKAVTIRGATNTDGSPTTVLDGLGNKRVLTCDSAEGVGTVIENLLITRGYSETDGGGMYLYGASPTIANCVFKANAATSAGGGMRLSASSLTITDCVFEGNTASTGGGMSVGSASPTITNCVFEANTATNSGGGISLFWASPTITNCVFEANTATTFGGGMWLGTSANPTIASSVFCGNTAPTSPQIYGSSWIDGGDNCFAFSCVDSDGNGWPDKCDSVGDGIHQVPSEYLTIEAALAAAGPGDVIEIAAGTYAPIATLNTMGKTVTIRGATNADGSPATVIDGLSNKRVLQCDNSEGTDTVFENLVITRGLATNGGGMHLRYANPTITNCVFEANTATNPSSGGGGGMHLSTAANPTIINCVFKANIATAGGGGMYVATAASPTIANCLFEANRATASPFGNGGGIYVGTDANPTITNCVLKSNIATYSGGGMYLEIDADPTITNCVFESNTATSTSSSGGGGIYGRTGANPIITGCLFKANTATRGGGISLSWASPTITNCVLEANTATSSFSGDGGGMFLYSADPIIRNCVFKANTATRGGGMFLESATSTPTLSSTVFCGNTAPNSPQIYGLSWIDGDDNCFAFSCVDSDGNGWPDKCGSVGDGIHQVPSEYPTIEDALAAAGNGDVIEIAAGTYAPTATLNTMGKAVTIRGAIHPDGTPATVIDGLGNKRVLTCEFSEASDTVFENLVITRGSASNGGGMFLGYSTPTITNCVFKANTATNPSSGGGGGMFLYFANPTITNCWFEANTATNSGGVGGGVGGGMYLYSASPAITNCVFKANAATSAPSSPGGGGGMFLYSATSTPTLTNTVFCGNTAPSFPQIYGSSWIDGGGNCFTFSCVDSDGNGWPDKCGSVGDGIHQVPSEYPTIEAALAAAGNGDVVLIAAGTYAPVATLNTMGKAVTIRGATHADGSPATVIDGLGNKRVLRCDTFEASDTVLENLVITRGSANNGGGMYLYSARFCLTDPFPAVSQRIP